MTDLEERTADLAAVWPGFEKTIRSWWKADLHTAREAAIRGDGAETLLYLPFPYSSAGGSEAAYPEMYGWDTYFIIRAMLDYGLTDVVREHILNQLFMIERYGFVLNGNRTYYLGRSQPPLHADMILRYIDATGDENLALRAYPLLRTEMLEYWGAEHHMSPIGLHTNCDILTRGPTDEWLSPELAAEAETGLDFSAIFEGDVRKFVPLITNCAIIRYLEVLEILASRLHLPEAEQWGTMRNERCDQVRACCWDEAAGFFFEYNFAEQRRGEAWSLCGFLPLWAGFATEHEAARVVEHLPRFQQPYGLAQTDRHLPSPHPKLPNVQWNYPAGWPPFQVLVSESLRAYGFTDEARACDIAWLHGCHGLFERTGYLYEKYNVVENTNRVPMERSDMAPPFHGWSSASCLLAGRALFGPSAC